MLSSLLRRVFRESGSRTAAPNTAAAERPRVERLRSALAAQTRGDSDAAEAEYLDLIGLHPADAEALHLLGHFYRLQKRPSEAVAMLTRAAAARPDVAEIQFELGQARAALGDVDGAIEAYRKALALNPGFVAALANLAGLYKAKDDPDAVERCYRRMLEIDPGFEIGHSGLGITLLEQGRVDEAIASFRTAAGIDPPRAAAHSYLLYAVNFDPAHGEQRIFEEHRAWAERHADPFFAQVKPIAARAGRRKLRIAYVSPNFYDHPVAYFFEPALKHHDFEAFDVICYSDVERPDASTERLQRYGTWRSTVDLDDEQFAKLVREDEVDILVDLTGHTNGHRLLVFARRPAPIQITWNGYANTTGMRAIDYRITDAYADPPGSTEHLHSEKLLRLPDVYMAFEPPRASPPVLPRAPEAGAVTFASFNALSKINGRVIATWARILGAMPDARLAIYTVPEGSPRARLAAAFEACGVSAERIEFHRRLPLDRFLGAIATADIALDPFPFAGTTTTCYTLWMGVPVITLAGATHAGRVGVSFLSSVGLQDLVAGDEDDYVRRAIALAQDPARLAALRGSLRERMLASPLTDGPRLTRHLEAAYLRMWNEYCAQAA